MTPEQHLNNVCRGFLKRGASQEEALALRAWINEKKFVRTRCRYCREKVSAVSWSLDHDQPLSRGGPHSLENLVLCCKRCNRAKGNMTGYEYLLLISFLKDTFAKDVAENVLRRLSASGFMYRR